MSYRKRRRAQTKRRQQSRRVLAYLKQRITHVALEWQHTNSERCETCEELSLLHRARYTLHAAMRYQQYLNQYLNRIAQDARDYKGRNI